MIPVFPSLSNLLRSFALNFAATAAAPKDGEPAVSQPEADPIDTDEKTVGLEDAHEFGIQRWAYRGHYRSMFPPIF
jgi:hypothetical protein